MFEFPRRRRPFRDRIWDRDERLEELARRAAEAAGRKARRRRGGGVSLDEIFVRQWEAEVKLAFELQGSLMRDEIAREERPRPFDPSQEQA